MDKSQIKNYDELKQKVDKINKTILALEKEYKENNLEQRMYEANQEKYSIQEEVEDVIMETAGEIDSEAAEEYWKAMDEIVESLGLEVESTYWMPSSAIC